MRGDLGELSYEMCGRCKTDAVRDAESSSA